MNHRYFYSLLTSLLMVFTAFSADAVEKHLKIVLSEGSKLATASGTML